MKTLTKSRLITLPKDHSDRLGSLCSNDGHFVMEEIWKDVKGYEGLYWISNYGNVKSLKKVLTHKKHKGGYSQVALCKNGFYKYFYVHRIVAMSFLQNPFSKRTVNHIDGNKKNNAVWNLEWSTHSENHNHAYSNNLKIGAGRKLSLEQAKEIRDRHSKGERLSDLAREFKINTSTITVLIQFKTYKH